MKKNIKKIHTHIAWKAPNPLSGLHLASRAFWQSKADPAKRSLRKPSGEMIGISCSIGNGIDHALLLSIWQFFVLTRQHWCFFMLHGPLWALDHAVIGKCPSFPKKCVRNSHSYSNRELSAAASPSDPLIFKSACFNEYELEGAVKRAGRGKFFVIKSKQSSLRCEIKCLLNRKKSLSQNNVNKRNFITVAIVPGSVSAVCQCCVSLVCWP